MYLRFSQGLRDENILWLLGVYLEYVEDFVGHVKYMQVMANYQAIPALVLILGTNNIDFNARGLPEHMTLALGIQ